MFDLQVSVGEKVLRALLIYLFLVIALRIVGKRELGQTNTLDLVVLLLVANAVQNGIIGNDNTVTGAVIGAATLFAINEVFNRTAYGWPLVSRLLEGNPSILIEKGKPAAEDALQGGDLAPRAARDRAPSRLRRPRRGSHRHPGDERRRDDVPQGRARPLSPGGGRRPADREAPPRPLSYGSSQKKRSCARCGVPSRSGPRR